MSTQNQNNSKPQDLNEQEQQETTGGSLLGNGLLGNDNNTLTGITQGYVNVSNTDDNGDTSSTGVDFGSGSMFGSQDGGSSSGGTR